MKDSFLVLVKCFMVMMLWQDVNIEQSLVKDILAPSKIFPNDL